MLTRLLVATVLLAVAASPMGCSDCDLEVQTNSIPPATVGTLFSFQLHSQCGGGNWFIDSGSLPPGIGLLQSGLLRGVPTDAGTFSFTVTVVDDDTNDHASKGLSLSVFNPS